MYSMSFADAIGVKDKAAIAKFQSNILNVLRKYENVFHMDEPKRYGKILLRLPALRTVSAKAAERFLALTLDGSLKLSELVVEMMT